MRKRHTSAKELFNRLLDRFEALDTSKGPGNKLSEFVSQKFPSQAQEVSFKGAVEQAQRTGAVKLEMDKGDNDHLMKKVILVDAQRLYQFLDRAPKVEKVSEAERILTGFVQSLPSSHQAHAQKAAERLVAQWKVNRRPHRLGEGDYDAVELYLKAYGAALAKEEADRRDLRTYSRVACGDSKLIENQLSRIISELREQGQYGPDTDDDAITADLGLEKFPHLVQFSADIPFSKEHFDKRAHMGIHPSLIDDLHIPSLRALVTIENYASFNRYVSEAMAPGMAVLYTGGWPGSGEKALIRKLSRHVTEGVYHWGDIDMAGAAIADAIWKLSEAPFYLHQMEPELARQKGDPRFAKEIKVSENSPAKDLIDWLSGEDAFTLEQEELDPVPV